MAIKAALNTKAAETDSKISGIKNLATNLDTEPTKIVNEILDTARFITTSELID